MKLATFIGDWLEQRAGLGTPIRIIREPYFGRLGEVAALPSDLQTIPSGAKVRVLEALLDRLPLLAAVGCTNLALHQLPDIRQGPREFTITPRMAGAVT